MLVVFQSEERFFIFDESEGFDVLVDLFPHGFGVDPELKDSAVFEGDE